MYLTYADYQNMGGTLDETTFNNFEYEAETIVNWYTFNRLKDEEVYPEELPKCMNRLIYLLKLEADALLLGKQTTTITETTEEGSSVVVDTQVIETDATIRSQSNDGVSVSYNTVDASDIANRLMSNSKDNPLMQTVFRYLQGVRNSQGKRLTYRGMYPDE